MCFVGLLLKITSGASSPTMRKAPPGLWYFVSDEASSPRRAELPKVKASERRASVVESFTAGWSVGWTLRSGSGARLLRRNGGCIGSEVARANQPERTRHDHGGGDEEKGEIHIRL